MSAPQSGRRGRTRFLTDIAYRNRVLPWDLPEPDPALKELVEDREQLPPGRAVDVGCGACTNLIYLVQHGWEATGVDYLGSAIAEGQRRTLRAGVTARLIDADVTDLSGYDLGDPFDLVIDIGCFMGIPVARREAYVAEVVRLTRPDAPYFLFAFGRSRARLRYTGVPGADSAELRARFDESFALQRSWPGPKQRWWAAGGWGDWQPMYYLFRRR